jgi:diguanylate cyclase (GGDEF)-like protein/PAS domain S-box-containing protein
MQMQGDIPRPVLGPDRNRFTLPAAYIPMTTLVHSSIPGPRRRHPFPGYLLPCLCLVTAAIHAAAAHAASESGLPEKVFPANVLVIAAGYLLFLVILMLSLAANRRESRRVQELAASLQEHKELFQIFSDSVRNSAVFLLDAAGKIRSWNAGAERIHGFQTREAIGRPFGLLFTREEVQAGRPDGGMKIAAANGHYESSTWLLRKNEAAFHAHMVVKALRTPAGALRGYAIVTRDMTEMKQAEELLRKLSLSVEQSADLVLITDREGKIEYVNKAVEDVMGYTRDEFIAKGMEALQSENADSKLYREMWNTVLSGYSFQAECTLRRKNGEQVILEEVVTPITDVRGTVTHALVTATDVTPVKVMQDKLAYLTSYDDLTGLPNRSLFADRLNRDRARAANGTGAMAVLAIDIDRFKYINEIYGLEAGNKVLKQVAESLSVSVSKDDTVARLGSDEFGIILHEIRKPSDVILFVKMIMKNVPQIIMSGGEEISVTLDVGISMFPDDGKDAHTLMKNADIALSKAKAQGRNNFQFYTPDMNVGVSEIVFMERQLQDALRKQEYVLAYQPYCFLSSGRVAGAEALLRWKNDEFGLVSPVKFIPMLEDTGMIIDVGKWVLKTACEQIHSWDRGASPLPVSVNLSLSQFRHEFLIETMENTIKACGIEPSRLTLEITESIFMKDQESAIGILKRLKSIGVSIAIDDFGTGYSSLSYLKKFPVDFVKIDQSFINDVAVDPDTTSLVAAIITMAHSLGLKTIAEGVENEDQGKILRLLKCDMAQGFYFSRAITPQEIERYMSQ